jgi:hypothetical protein
MAGIQLLATDNPRAIQRMVLPDDIYNLSKFLLPKPKFNPEKPQDDTQLQV